MNRYSSFIYLAAFFSFSTQPPVRGRSVLRPKNKSIPTIKTRWFQTEDSPYILRNSHLEEYAIFRTFNEEYFFQNILPTENISYRYKPEKFVDGATLRKMVDDVLKEIELKKKEYRDFIVLRKLNFNRRKKSGLLILKCKHHPFVVKIFIETPKSFMMHNSKGFVPIFLFYMAGGINRHLLGFTRIKNLENLQKRLGESPRWSQLVTMPRKWFLLPQKNKWIEIEGTNIGGKKKQTTKIPGTYCVISDFVDAERRTSVFNSKDRKICMELCNYLELAIDPHIDNFMIERNTKKIAIVDTEHFLTVVGMKEKKQFTSYFLWGVDLAKSCGTAMFFRTKKARKLVQLKKSETELTYDNRT